MKTCQCCGETKAITSFHRNRHLASGRQCYCKVCRAVKAKAHREKVTNEFWDVVGQECQRCNTEFPRHLLDLHHRNPKEKEASVSDYLGNSLAKALKEAEKCDVLCVMCHRQTHHEMRMDNIG